MKTKFFTLLWTVGTIVLAQCPDNITFTTQNDVAAFQSNFPNCVNIPGNVTVQGPFSFLDFLDQIESIGGDFKINSSQSLINLSGLENLETVGGVFQLFDNENIMEIDALSSLQTVGSDLIISNNLKLDNTDGLSGLQSVGGNFLIGDSTNGQQCDMTDINVPNLQSVGGLLRISYMFDVESISMNNLQTIGDYLEFYATVSAENISFQNLESIAEEFLIHRAESLNSMNFGSLVSVGDFFRIERSGLVNLNGLGALENVGFDFEINLNPNLQTTSGLNSIASVGRFLTIFDNDALTNLNGFETLTAVTSGLKIDQNNVLTDISGIQNIDLAGINPDDPFGPRLNMTQNPVLSICNYPNICAYLATDYYANIVSNSGDCMTTFTLRDACENMDVSDVSSGEIQMYVHQKNIHISSPGEKINSVEIVDLNGKKWISKENIRSNSFQINAVNISPKIIIVRIQTEKGRIETKKIMLK